MRFGEIWKRLPWKDIVDARPLDGYTPHNYSREHDKMCTATRMTLREFQQIIFSSRRSQMMSHALASTQLAVWGQYSTARVPGTLGLTEYREYLTPNNPPSASQKNAGVKIFMYLLDARIGSTCYSSYTLRTTGPVKVNIRYCTQSARSWVTRWNKSVLIETGAGSRDP